MRNRTALLSALVVAFSGLLAAQAQEFARVLRNGEEATLSVFGPRSVDLAAKKLVTEFGVAINVEDPVYLYRDDVQDVTPPRVASSGKRTLIPKAALLEMRFDLRPDGSLKDVRQLVQDLVDSANAQLPFLYRIDHDGDVFTLVASRTRDEQGRSVELTPILDRHVTIALGTRKVFEHVNLLTQALERQTGVRIGCCTSAVGGIPWGSTNVSFEARDEPARNVLLRLIRSEPGRDRLLRNPKGGGFNLVKADPGREHWHWLMRCQPGDAWCSINVAPIPEKF
jgi:hypothetical protein